MNSQPFIIYSTTRIQALRRLRIVKDFINFKLFDGNIKKPTPELWQTFKKDFATKSFKEESSVVQFENEQDLQFIESLGFKYLDSFNQSNLNGLFKETEKEIYQTKTLTLFIPFEIPHNEIDHLSSWTKQNFGQDTLLEFKFNPDLIGGCAISYKGVYKDFSIQKKIKEHQKEITDSLNSFRRQPDATTERAILTPPKA
jgi:hypothetical protein